MAEQCRSRSQALQTQAMELLAQTWAWNSGPGQHPSPDRDTPIAHLVAPSSFDDRLDAEFYRPRFLAVDSWLSQQECWELPELVHPPIKGVQPSYAAEGTIPALTVTHVDPFVLERGGANGFVTEGWLASNERARIEAGELLFTVTGPPLGETVVVEDFHLPAVVNSHVTRVRTRREFQFPHLLAGMLNSSLGQMQTTRFCKGIRQKELYPSDFLRFRFPKLAASESRYLNTKFAAACRLTEEARRLVEQAKADVEALIEGTLDVGAILTGNLKAACPDDMPELAEADA